MHPLHAADAGLAREPATVQALIGAVRQLTYVLHTEDADADAVIEQTRLELALRHATGADPLKDTLPHAWSIFWHGGWLMLRGHLFGRRGRAEETSPVLLINRQTCVAIYGPKLPELAVIVLGNTLADGALGQPGIHPQ